MLINVISDIIKLIFRNALISDHNEKIRKAIQVIKDVLEKIRGNALTSSRKLMFKMTSRYFSVVKKKCSHLTMKFNYLLRTIAAFLHLKLKIFP